MKINSRYLALLFGLLVLALILYYFSTIVAYVLVAWVLSMIGQPLMRFFQQHIKIGRFQAGSATSAMLTILCYFLVSFFLFWLFVPLIVEQARNLAEVEYGAIGAALEDPLNQLSQWLHRLGLLPEHVSAVDQFMEITAGWIQPASLGDFFSSLIGVAGNVLFAIFSVVFITFFFLKEQGLFERFIVTVTPPQYEDEISRAITSITHLLTRYFSGILLQITIITLLVSLALSLLGVKNALLIGFFAAVINVVPYLGPIIGAVLGIFITISSNLDLEFYTQMLPLLIKVAAVFGVLQLIDNFILQPYIFSTSVMAHPLEIFIVVLIGAQLNGILGMILAIPSYTVLRVVARGVLSEFKVVQKLTGSIDEVAP